MVRKFLLLIGFAFFLQTAHAQQQIILLTEDFEHPDSVFVSDTAGPGTQIGNNKWITNNEFDGQGTYPTTTPQDSVYFGNGTIYGAPHSTYLHIYNSASNPLIANANFDPNSTSDRFTYTRDGFCTLGMSPVKLVFFYMIEGDTTNASPTAYGQVYYSVDNGPWIRTGDTLYNHQTKWRYEQITDPAWGDKSNVRIGFRWVNTAGSIPKTISYGIDGVQVIATYDSVLNPLTITLDNVQPNPVCQMNYLFYQFHLSKVLCDGTYRIEISNSAGSFGNPVNLGTYNLGYPDTAGFLAVQIPAALPAGNCYRLRLTRLSPAPIVMSAVSPCFAIQVCPNTVTTLSAIVVTDPDTACVNSAIDIKFFSTGVFQNNNNYVAQLSDSTGSFANPTIIQSKPDAATYDPALGSNPGQVSGLIPVVPAGCGYYIRIVSTNGAAIGNAIGPYCLKHCDMETNRTIDIHVCINEVTAIDTPIRLDIHKFDSTAHYYNGNQFQLELLSMMTLGVVNVGGLFAVYDSVSNTYVLHVPNLVDLTNLGIAPGSYYARFIADSSNNGDTLGTIIRLTIGAPSATVPVIAVSNTIACNQGGGVGGVGGAIEQYYLLPPINSNSTYQWLAPFTNYGGTPFSPPPPPSAVLSIDFSGASPAAYSVRVREENYGCFGQFSPLATINIIGLPKYPIVGPVKACLGDTVQLTTQFLLATYYTWTSNWGNIIDTSNNQISAEFDSVGLVTIHNSALNGCGSHDTTYQLRIVSLVNVNVEKDTSVCRGEPVELKASTSGINNTVTTTFTTTSSSYQGAMFNVTARQPLTLNTMDGNFTAGGPVAVAVYYKTGSYVGFQNNSSAWTLIDTATINAPSPVNTPTPIPIPLAIAMNAGDTVAFYVTATSGNRVRFKNGTANLNSFIASDSILDIYQGPVVAYPFGNGLNNKIWSGDINYTTLAGLRYTWTNGDTLPNTTVRPDSTTQFTIRVSDTSGCGNVGKATVTILPTPAVNAGTDVNICYGTKVHVTATAGGTYHWVGLPDSTGLVFDVTPDSSVTYILQVTDPNISCKANDSLRITVTAPDTKNDSGLICASNFATLKLPEIVGGHYHWNTGDTTSSIAVIHAGTYTGTYQQPGDSCASRIIFKVEAKDDCTDILQVPQAFTPNADGVNDHFTVFGLNITDYEIKIFNRWGEMVYHSTDASEVNDLSRGWDGTHRGQLQNMGTFVYYIKAKDAYNNSAEQHGNLTLIR